MRPSAALLLALFASFGNALSWYLPPDIEDGFYSLRLDEANNQAPVLETMEDGKRKTLATLNSSLDLPLEHTLSRRGEEQYPPAEFFPVKKKGCIKNDRRLDPADHYDTKMAMANWCSQGWNIGDKAVVIGVRNDTVYWVCNNKLKGKWGPARNSCRPGEIMAAEKVFNETCGPDKGAWVKVKNLKKTYGRMVRGTNEKNRKMRC